MIKNIPDELFKLITQQQYPEERHIHGYNWCGSGTKFEERFNYETETPMKGHEPVNTIDEACFLHDLAYYKNKKAYDKLCPVQKREARKNFQQANWRADDELVKRATSLYNVISDPLTILAINAGIKGKELAEKKGYLDTKTFSGIGLRSKNMAGLRLANSGIGKKKNKIKRKK